MSSSFFFFSSSSIFSFSSSIRMLSLSPGKATPTTTLLLPSERSLAFFTSIFENLSWGRTMPDIMAKGTLISCSLPPIITFLVSLFS